VQVTFDCSDPEELARFWAEVLEYPVPEIDAWHERLRAAGVPEEEWRNFFRIEDPADARPRLFFQKVPESKVAKNRVHLDVSVGRDPEDTHQSRVDTEVDRVLGLGATKLRSVDDEGGYYVVMQDPEGNEFCID
jgi:hypothetical protein